MAFTQQKRKQKHMAYGNLLSPLCIGLVFLSFTFGSLFALSFLSHADGPTQNNKADIIIQFDDQDVIVREIDFSDPISGLKGLELTGLDVVTQDYGGGFIAVCSIEGVGCPATDCFCDPQNYWGYNFWDGTTWQGYLVGATQSVISDTAIEGWRWGPFGSSMPPAPPIVTVPEAFEWLHPQQSADGGYGGNQATLEMMLSLAANKFSPAKWRSTVTGSVILDYWQQDAIPDDQYPNNAAKYASISAAAAGKLSLAVSATGQNARDFAGVDLVMSMTTYYSPTTNMFGLNNLDQMWVMLGWRQSQTGTLGTLDPTLVQARQKLAENVNSDGGWAWIGQGAESDSNSTALALQALASSGECLQSPLINNGLAYLKTTQNTDGGFGYNAAGESDTNSTAWVVQALHAVGEDPTQDPWTIAVSPPITGTGSITTITPLDYIMSQQLNDGSFEWTPETGSNQLATQQAILPLLGKTYLFGSPTSKCNASYQVYIPLITK